MEETDATVPHLSTNKASGLVQLVDALQSISTTHPLARLNESTIADNNGGRIEL